MNTSSAPQNPKRPRRWLKRLAWSFLWLVTLLILAVVVLNWKGARAWKAAVEELNAKGDSLDIASVIPPMIPDQDNMASAPIFAQLFEPRVDKKQGDLSHPSLSRITLEPLVATRVFKYTGWRSGQPVDLVSWQECLWESVKILKTNPKKAEEMPEVWKEHFKNNYWIGPQQTPAQDVLFALSAFEGELNQVREASERPDARFPLQYEKGFEVGFPHYQPLMQLVRVVALKGSIELALDHQEVALEDVLLAFRLTDSIKSDPFLISYLVRLSLLNIAYQPLWNGIAQHRWNDLQLASLEHRLCSINLLEHLRQTRSDRNIGLSAIGLIQRDPEFYKTLVVRSDDTTSKWVTPALKVIPQGWFDYNKVNMIRSWDKMFACFDLKTMRVFPERFEVLKSEKQNITSSPRFLTNMFSSIQSDLIKSLTIRCAFHQDIIGLARIAISLERHFLKHGSYPETLAGLDEGFSLKGGIPHDVATGNPPRYSRTSSDRFVLYYDGWNGKDDGGTTHTVDGKVSNDYDQGDWVWPMPAE